MKRVRAAVLIGAVMVCLEAGKPQDSAILPQEAREAIEQTPCPEAAGISPEECLLWFSSPSEAGVDADRIARDLGRGEMPDGAAAAAAESQIGSPRSDGLRGRAKD